MNSMKKKIAQYTATTALAAGLLTGALAASRAIAESEFDKRRNYAACRQIEDLVHRAPLIDYEVNASEDWNDAFSKTVKLPAEAVRRCNRTAPLAAEYAAMNAYTRAVTDINELDKRSVMLYHGVPLFRRVPHRLPIDGNTIVVPYLQGDTTVKSRYDTWGMLR